MTKIAMIKLGTNKELKELGFKPLFPVHDEVIAECPFENRKRCAELMSQLMIESGQEKIKVPMKCDCTCFFRWYGDEISFEDTPEALQQYKEYCDSFDK